MIRVFCFALLAFILTVAPARAQQWVYPQQDYAPHFVTQSRRTPDLIYVGMGAFDFDRSSPRPRSSSLDLRAEYRWGVSLLPLISRRLASWDNTMQVRPLAGLETSTRGLLFVHGGLLMDVYFLRNGVFTWSETAGLYGRGGMRDMGSLFQIRSQLELGWRFRNEMRVSTYISHISNGGTAAYNPGGEILGVYFAFPLNWMKK